MKLFWILLSTCALAADTGYFYNPPGKDPSDEYENNPVYTLGKTVQMRWSTTLESLTIILWQVGTDDFERVQANLRGVTSYDWIVSTTQDLSNGEVFYFDIRNASNINDFDAVFTSRYFNITDDGASTSTTSSASSATQPTVSTPLLIPSSTNQSIPTATTAASDSSEESSGLSNGAKIGVGVGVGVGGAFFAALALFFFLRRRSKKSMQTNASSPPAMGSNPYNEQPHNKPPEISEAPANEARLTYELQ